MDEGSSGLAAYVSVLHGQLMDIVQLVQGSLAGAAQHNAFQFGYFSCV
jgi:hypothetical protein